MNDPFQDHEDPFSTELEADPFVDDHFGNRGSLQPVGLEQLPEANAVLVLGILSLVAAFFYGIFGLVLSIIALALATKPMRLYRTDPQRFSKSSYNNLNAGRICAIVGLTISLIIILVVVVVVGVLVGSMAMDSY